MKKPSWFIDTKTLNRWQTIQGLFFFPGHIAQIILTFHNAPYMVWLKKPIRIEEINHCIVATFALNDDEREACYIANRDVPAYIWKSAIYNRELKAFVGQINPGDLEHLENISNSRYLKFDERQALAAKLAGVNEVKPVRGRKKRVS